MSYINKFDLLNDGEDMPIKKKEDIKNDTILKYNDNEDFTVKKYYKNYKKATPITSLKNNVVQLKIVNATIDILNDNMPSYYNLFLRHVEYDKNWNNIQSFTKIKTIYTWYELMCMLNSLIHNNNTKNFNIFIMKNEISPLWEDNENRHGSRTNIKVEFFEECFNIIKHLMQCISNNSLFIDEYNTLNTIQGITFNPKVKQGVVYYIVQIWYKINFTNKFYKNNDFLNKNVLKFLNNYSIYTRKQKPEF